MAEEGNGRNGEAAQLPNEAEVRQALKSVYDPEIGLSIEDLGLVYGVHYEGARCVIVRAMRTASATALPPS